MAEYLERNGLRVRIVNLAVRMLNDQNFDPEAAVKALHPAAFGIDLHWLPHAHGSLELAKVVKVVKTGALTKAVKLTGIGATAGAKAVIEGNIMPVNPMDQKDS